MQNNNKMAVGSGLLKAFVWLFIGAFAVSSLYAMPPYRDIEGRMKAGVFEESYYLKNIDRLRQMGLNSPGDLLTKNGGGLAKASVSGNINILTILVDFSDKKAQTSTTFFDTLVYADQSGTVRNYYEEVSYNTLAITTVVLPSSLGWTQAPQTYAYYCDGQNGFGSYPQNVQKLVEDAVDAVNSQVDFSQFDNDSDNYVDGLIVVHSGPGAELTGSNNDIWSHKWAISPRYLDNVYVSTYSMEPEYWYSSGDMTCGVYCHELGHVFGLPDLYDTENPSDSEGIGNWSIMAGGSWNGTLGGSPAHFDAWCKIQLGFVTPTVLSADQSNVSIPAVKDSAKVYKLWTGGSPGNEYYLVENRQQIGYDTHLPGNGLLIWHVDDSQADNEDQWWPGCGWSEHYEVALVQADNQWHMEHNTNRGDTGDPYPGSTTNRTFNGSSSPNSNAYSGSATSVAVTNISNSGTTMTADLAIGVPQYIENDHYTIPNKAHLFQNHPNPFNAETRISFRLISRSFVQIEIYDITGRSIKKLFSGDLDAGMYKLIWDGTNRAGDPVNSGVYLYGISLANKSIFRKMALLK
jgi:immune inhibitor A